MGGPAYGWVPKDGSAMGGLKAIVGGCVGCGGSMVGCVFCFCFFLFWWL